MKYVLAILALVAIFGCTTVQQAEQRVAAKIDTVKSAVTGDPADPTGADGQLLGQSILKFTLADLEAAAAYADAHGYPARAAVYRAHAAHLSAVKLQVEACKAAIRDALPKPVDASNAGAFLLFEMAAEKVGQGIPAAVKINCGAIVLP